MSHILEGLEPHSVMHYFEEICNIPHVSYHTEKISEYIISFAKEKGLDYYSDDSGNVVIYKKASAGYENHGTVILQGHVDMVGAKTEGSKHDFENDPIRLDPEAIKEGYITAVDTTLGGDDGIAVAYMLSILADPSLKHPPLECVFTVNEEVGLLGADALDLSVLKGKVMLNMDSEDEGIFTTGSAGGMHMDCTIPMTSEDFDGPCCRLIVSGLLGGHSGTSIGTGRPSAIVLLGRLLHLLEENTDFALVEMKAGEVDNAIANKAEAVITCDGNDISGIKDLCERLQAELRVEYRGIDDGITISCIQEDPASCKGKRCVSSVSGEKAIFFLKNAPYGVQSRNAYDIQLVETSLNPGVLRMDSEHFMLGYSIRSSVESAKHELADRLTYLTEFLGGTVDAGGDYPGWAYDPDSKLRPLCGEVYEEVSGKKAQFETIHAGLECGIFYHGIPGLDIISYGPDMKDIHTFDEKLSIESVKRTYEMTLKLLERL